MILFFPVLLLSADICKLRLYLPAVCGLFFIVLLHFIYCGLFYHVFTTGNSCLQTKSCWWETGRGEFLTDYSRDFHLGWINAHCVNIRNLVWRLIEFARKKDRKQRRFNIKLFSVWLLLLLMTQKKNASPNFQTRKPKNFNFLKARLVPYTSASFQRHFLDVSAVNHLIPPSY